MRLWVIREWGWEGCFPFSFSTRALSPALFCMVLSLYAAMGEMDDGVGFPFLGFVCGIGSISDSEL